MSNPTNDRIDEILRNYKNSRYQASQSYGHHAFNVKEDGEKEFRQAIQKLLIEARMDENRALKQAEERSWKVDNDFLIPDKYASRRIFQLQDQLNTLEGK